MSAQTLYVKPETSSDVVCTMLGYSLMLHVTKTSFCVYIKDCQIVCWILKVLVCNKVAMNLLKVKHATSILMSTFAHSLNFNFKSLLFCFTCALPSYCQYTGQVLYQHNCLRDGGCNGSIYLNLETKYNAKAIGTYRHHSTYKSDMWQHKK